MKLENITLHEDRNVQLTALLQDVGGEFTGIEKRPAVIVLPGGGYSMCSDREADPVAMVFAQAGYQAFILRYTVNPVDKEHIWPHPIEDYDEAFDYIRDHADSWHVDMERVAVCGFSAGGHLAACAATMARNRPAAAILGYPAILPGIVDGCAKGLPYPCEHIDRKTPPCFIFIARDDVVVHVKNATAFADALTDHGVTFELHAYSYGNHGFTTGLSYLNKIPLSIRARNWTQDAIGFLEEVWGQFTALGYTEPQISRAVNGNYDAFLSVNCTVDFLEKQGAEAKAALKDVLEGITSLLKKSGLSEQAVQSLKATMSLKNMLAFTGTNADTIQEINRKLQQIPTMFEEE